ncbi:MAG: cupredoxin domain-containing protein [Nanoarchaeota archaeon]
MKNTSIIIGIILIIIIGGYFLFNVEKEKPVANNEIINETQDVQNIVISFRNYNYYPNEIRIKANQKVRLTLDESVTGCYRFFTIRSLGISKYLESSNDVLEFIVKKPGIYKFSCSMGMGYGNLIVE